MTPSGTGCVECDATGGWWMHLRRCAECGHVGLLRHLAVAARHRALEGHRPPPIVQSFEPGEDWFRNYDTEEAFAGPRLAPPAHHPPASPCLGPPAGYHGTGGFIFTSSTAATATK